MKKILKYILIFLCGSLLLLFSCCLAWYHLCYKAKTVVELIDIEYESRLIILIEIDGESYNFLFDTGCSLSCIKQELAYKLGYDTISRRVPNITEIRVDTVVNTIFLACPVVLKIGDIAITTTIVFPEKNRFDLFENERNFDAVLGQDIISEYN